MAYVKRKRDCSDKELHDFVALASGGHKVHSLKLDRVELIGFFYEGDVLIATRCLKHPFLSYKQRIFAAARMEEYHPIYTLESGYSFTLERFRGFGLSTLLLRLLLKHPLAKRYRVFGTTLMHNTPIIKCYLKVGAKPIGRPFCSENGMVLIWKLN